MNSPTENIKIPDNLPIKEPELPKNITLTEDQKNKIVICWNERPHNPPTIIELIELVFPGIKPDARSKEGRAVKDFLSSRNLLTTVQKPITRLPPLTEAQKEFIGNNYQKMQSLELVKELHNKYDLTPGSLEFRQVTEYKKTLPSNVFQKTDPETQESDGSYRPPKTVFQAAARINRYILNCVNTDDIEKNSKLKTNLVSLIKYCHNKRFQLLINSYQKQLEKELFEDSYVRYLWDKGENILEEELDLYINLCCGLVKNNKMKEEEDFLMQLREDILNESDGKKLSMTVVQSLHDLREQAEDSEKQQKELVKHLQGMRSNRVDNKDIKNASMVNLIDFWRVQDNRELYIKLAQSRQEQLGDEVKRIQNLDDLKMQVFGIDPSEIL